jgi:hypothetical protein
MPRSQAWGISLKLGLDFRADQFIAADGDSIHCSSVQHAGQVRSDRRQQKFSRFPWTLNRELLDENATKVVCSA